MTTNQEQMGITIKKLREAKGLSQSQLAELVGYKDKTAIAKVEAGKVDLPQSKILAFSKALHVSTSELFGTEPPMTIAAHFDGDEYTQEELSKIREFAAFVKSNRK